MDTIHHWENLRKRRSRCFLDRQDEKDERMGGGGSTHWSVVY